MLIDAQEAAHTLGRQLLVLNVGTPSEVDPPSPPCGNGGPTRFLSVAIHSSAAGASRLSLWPRVTPFLPCTSTANMSKRAG